MSLYGGMYSILVDKQPAHCGYGNRHNECGINAFQKYIILKNKYGIKMHHKGMGYRPRK